MAVTTRSPKSSSKSGARDGAGALTIPGQESEQSESGGVVAGASAKGALRLPGQSSSIVDSDLTQYLGPFHAVFNQAIDQQLPPLFAYLRVDTDGGDSRGSQVGQERSLADFLALLRPVVDQLVPFLIEQVLNEQHQRTSRGEPEDLDQKAQDRFWGALLSAAIPLVVDNLPAIVKETSAAFSGGGIFGGLFGGRAYEQQVSRELFVPPVADREMVARFWGPLVSVLGGALSSCLPELFRIVQGRGVTRDYTISWGDLNISNRLWDNDVVAVVGISDIDDPNACEFVLELAWPKTWWKGIQVQDDNGSLIQEIAVHDNNRVGEGRVPADYILRGGYLLFMKAKMFGIHTGMYRMSTARMEQLRGKRVHFLWAAD